MRTQNELSYRLETARKHWVGVKKSSGRCPIADSVLFLMVLLEAKLCNEIAFASFNSCKNVHETKT